MPITIEVNDARVLDSLRELASRIHRIQPALQEIGEHLQETTTQRFGSQTAPDGTHWLANSLVTIERKGGKPVLTDGGTLGSTLDYQVTGDELLVGSNLDYAAMMQFGGTKEEFPQLWGDIPARPFLGISDDDSHAILDILRDYLAQN